MSISQSLVALSALPISGRYWDAILSHGGADAVWRGDPEIWQSMLGRGGQKMSVSEASQRALSVRHFENAGGQIMGVGGPHELGRLLNAPSPPLCAYLRGNRHLLAHRPTIAIIGTREPSDRGRERAGQLASQLAEAGCLIVSGGASGIDMAAHEGALVGGGETLAVLGNPIYPTQDERPLRIRGQNKISTLTVFGPWVKVSKALFVVRNQYVAALADALVVIEGKLDSGTLHTARYAKQMNIPVWAVPGDPDNPLAGAANLLLSEGTARALVNVSSLRGAIGDVAIRSGPLDCHAALAMTNESDNPIINALRLAKGRLTFDLLCDAVGQPVSELQKNLLELQMMGTIFKQGTELVLK